VKYLFFIATLVFSVVAFGQTCPPPPCRQPSPKDPKPISHACYYHCKIAEKQHQTADTRDIKYRAAFGEAAQFLEDSIRN